MNSQLVLTGMPAIEEFLVAETLNVNVAIMAGLSANTKRAYSRWIHRFLTAVNRLDPVESQKLNLAQLDINLAERSMNVALLKAWLGSLKEAGLGAQSLSQARASVMRLAEGLADQDRLPEKTLSGMGRIKPPKAETGQRAGKWLAKEDIERLLAVSRGDSSMAVRDHAIIVLLVICGLRRDEICAMRWGDLGLQGDHNVAWIHGKGEKLRTVKLPDMAFQALDDWRKKCKRVKGPVFLRIRGAGASRASALRIARYGI